jgi:hypothetical protein
MSDFYSYFTIHLFLEAYSVVTDEMQKRGVMLAGDPLKLARTAMTVRVRNKSAPTVGWVRWTRRRVLPNQQDEHEATRQP